ncbi:MAG: OmpA family protein [Bacteroidales bacterium]
MKHFILLFFLTLTLTTGLTQQKSQKPSELFQDAEYYRLYEEYSEALPLYQQLINDGYDNAHINYRIGECYLELAGHKERAIPFLEKAVENINKKFKEGSLKETGAPVYSIFYLGKAYQVNDQLDKALRTYNKFLEQIGEKEKDEYNMSFVEKQIQSCKNAKELMKEPLPVTFENLGDSINSSNPNTRPAINSKQTRIVYVNKLKFYDAVFMAEKKGGKWEEPVNLTPQIKSDGNFYPTSLNKKGDKLILMKSSRYKGDLYISKFDKENNQWKEPEKLGKNINTNNWETHGHLCNDGKTLYFTSNRKEGMGGLDIYVSHYNEDNKEWGPAKNLGENINTPYNEETPFLTDDEEEIYFSSQGHYGMGGFDIFYSEKLEDGSWSEPINAGYPINTTDDDLFYQPVNKGKDGYMSRFRPDGFGNSDIYKITYTPEDTISKAHLKGAIYPPHGETITAGQLKISIQNTDDDGKKYKPSLTDSATFSEKLRPGEYKIIIKAEEKYKPIEKTIAIRKEYKRKSYPVAFNLKPKTLPIKGSLKIQNIYFDFNDYSIPDTSKTGLDNLVKAMKKYPDINLEITGHTDSIGNKEYNKRLSQKRAQSVINYIKQQGIPEDKLSMEAEGEEHPVAINTLQNGKDSPEGRQYNRRVELMPVSSDNKYIIENVSKIPNELRNKGQVFYCVLLTREKEQLPGNYFERFSSLQDYTIKEYSNGQYFYVMGEFTEQGNAIEPFKKALEAGFNKARIISSYKLQDIVNINKKETREEIINE